MSYLKDSKNTTKPMTALASRVRGSYRLQTKKQP